MPVIRISDRTWERLKAYAIPLEDTPDDVINRVIEELERSRSPAPAPGADTGDERKASSHEPKRRPRGKSLRREKFRRPLMETLYEQGGSASLAQIRPIMETKVAP